MSVPIVVTLSGDIDAYSAPIRCRALDQIRGPAVIDLSDVRILSAAGLTELVRVARRVGSGRVTLTGANPGVRRILLLANFDTMFRIE